MTEILRIYVAALGSNLSGDAGAPLVTLRKALGLFSGFGMMILKKSSWYQTPAFPKGSGPDYVNGAVLFESAHSPAIVLQNLHTIESVLGRVRGRRWAARICDLDLISCGDLVLPDRKTMQRWMQMPVGDQTAHTPETLILPHPRMQDRGFVLKPMADIAPDWMHPLLGVTVMAMLAALPASELRGISRLEG
jgi:2-amino-4-hydroxy-6-hydroxymethyldihydropteridine diphosphokinase